MFDDASAHQQAEKHTTSLVFYIKSVATKIRNINKIYVANPPLLAALLLKVVVEEVDLYAALEMELRTIGISIIKKCLGASPNIPPCRDG